MLTSALDQYREQQRISAFALREARRTANRGSLAVARLVGRYQMEAVALTFGSNVDILAEQGIDAPPEGRASVSSLLTGTKPTTAMLDQAADHAAFDGLILSLVQDAGRTASAVDIGRRRGLTGYVRSLNPPSCSRCGVLAGRVYRYSTGFLRHPRCDCLMTPTNDTVGQNLVTDPTDLVKNGQIRGLSKADMQAIDAGADLGQVVNVRRKAAGLTVGSSVMVRAGRLTPQGVLTLASDKAEVLVLLRRYGYLS